MLSLSILDSVLNFLKLPGKSVQQDLIKLLAVRLYEKGALGLGKTSELCGADRSGFLHLLKEEQAFLNYDDEELDRIWRRLNQDLFQGFDFSACIGGHRRSTAFIGMNCKPFVSSILKIPPT